MRNNHQPMFLTLTYTGLIRSAQGKNSRRSIRFPRNQFHKQLSHSKQLFDNFDRSAYKNFTPFINKIASITNPVFPDYKPIIPEGQNEYYRGPVTLDNKKYVALLTRDNYNRHPTISLDITFYSPSSPRRVITNAGDLDNRAKFLIDALRLPSRDEEARKENYFPDDSEVCNVLLEDDSFITELSVRQVRTLGDPNSDEVTAIILVDLLSVG